MTDLQILKTKVSENWRLFERIRQNLINSYNGAIKSQQPAKIKEKCDVVSEKFVKLENSIARQAELITGLENNLIESSKCTQRLNELFIRRLRFVQLKIEFSHGSFLNDSLNLHAESNISLISNEVCENNLETSITCNLAKHIVFEQKQSYRPILPKVKPVVLADKISMEVPNLSEEEFTEVPKYMIGRTSLQAVNDFINTFNRALTKKYNLLNKKKTEVKAKEMSLYLKYKRESLQMKGKQFLTEEDIAKEFNLENLDKKSFSFLTILRSTKRISEKRIKGCVYFILS